MPARKGVNEMDKLTDAQQRVLDGLRDGYKLRRHVDGTQYEWMRECLVIVNWRSPHAGTVNALINKGLAVGKADQFDYFTVTAKK
jgi:hypothetical protein